MPKSDDGLSLHQLLDELEKVKQQMKKALKALEQETPNPNAAWSILGRQVTNLDGLQARIRNLAKDPSHGA